MGVSEGRWKFPRIVHAIPIGSMYAIYGNIWDILMVNVTIYTIHGSYGIHSIVHKPLV